MHIACLILLLYIKRQPLLSSTVFARSLPYGRVSYIVVHKHEIPVSPSHRHIQNPEIARALEKIRRFHAVVKANGGTTVDLVQMAAGNAETAAVGVPGYPHVTQHARY